MRRKRTIRAARVNLASGGVWDRNWVSQPRMWDRGAVVPASGPADGECPSKSGTGGRYRDTPRPRIRREMWSEIPLHVGTAAPKDVGEEFVCFPYLRRQH